MELVLLLLLLMVFFALVGLVLLVALPVVLLRARRDVETPPREPEEPEPEAQQPHELQPGEPGPSGHAEVGREHADASPVGHGRPRDERLGSHAPPAAPPMTASSDAADAPAAPPPGGRDLEAVIGTRWLLYIGVIAIVLGLAYFVRYAFAQIWLNEVVRVVVAALAGVALIGLGHRLVRGGAALFGQVLSGGGLVVLYVAVYAAYGYYGLLGNTIAFALLLAVTALAYVLARHHESFAFAVLAVIGGFVTPFLAGGYRESPLALLTFDLVLVAGTALMATRHGWPGLMVVAYGATIGSLLAWAGTAYTSSLWLATELSLTGFAALFTWGAVIARRSASPFSAGLTTVLLTAPVLYYVASLGLLSSHTGALLLFLVLLTLVAVVLDLRFARAEVTLLFWLAAAVPFWVQTPDVARGDWLGTALACGATIHVLHLLLAWRAAAAGASTGVEEAAAPRRGLSRARVALLHLNGWWLFAVMYELLGVHAPDWRAPATLGLASLNGLASLGLWPRVRHAAMHHVGLALGLTAAAIVIWLEGHVATVALAIEGGLLVWLGLAGRLRWVRGVGELLIAVAGVRLLGSLMSRDALVTPFVNTLVLTAVCVIAIMYLSASLYRRWAPTGAGLARAALFVGGNVLTVLALTVETSRVFRELGYTGDWLTSPGLARQGTISALWAAYALVLVAVGLVRRYAPIRYLALALFALTILKVFLVDLAALSQAYKMATVLVVGVLLLIASYLYTRRPVQT